MTEYGIPSSTTDPAVDRSIPRSVLVAFWLWWPLLVAQAALAAFMIFGLVKAIVTLATIPYSGPTAGTFMLIAVPLALVLVALLAIETRQTFALRRGSRRARSTLLVLATLTALGTGWIFVGALRGLEDANDEGYSRLYAVGTGGWFLAAVVAVAGAILTLLPGAADHFPQTSGSAASDQPSVTSPTDDPS